METMLTANHDDAEQPYWLDNLYVKLPQKLLHPPRAGFECSSRLQKYMGYFCQRWQAYSTETTGWGACLTNKLI